MNLLECLNNYIGVDVKIGSKCGFVYCDKVPADIDELLDQLTKKEDDKIVFYKNKYIAHLNNFDDYWNRKIKNTLASLKKNKKTKEVINLIIENLKAEKAKDLIKTNKNVEHYKHRINIFTPFATRDVVDIYDSDYDAGTKIILFKGEEQGAYWFKGDGEND